MSRKKTGYLFKFQLYGFDLEVELFQSLIGGGWANKILKSVPVNLNIMITSPCDLYPRTPHFYIAKLGFTGVFIIFLFLL